MDYDSPDIPREYLLKQIENEINLGFVFVAMARNALRTAKVSDASVALARADEVQRQIAVIASDSQVEHIRAITHQLSELRSAIEWLLTGFEPNHKDQSDQNS